MCCLCIDCILYNLQLFCNLCKMINLTLSFLGFKKYTMYSGHMQVTQSSHKKYIKTPVTAWLKASAHYIKWCSSVSLSDIYIHRYGFNLSCQWKSLLHLLILWRGGKKQSSCIMEEGVLHMNSLSAVEVLKVQPSLTSLHCASTSAHTSLIGTLILGCITLLSQLQVPLLVGQRSRCRTHPVARHWGEIQLVCHSVFGPHIANNPCQSKNRAMRWKRLPAEPKRQDCFEARSEEG